MQDKFDGKPFHSQLGVVRIDKNGIQADSIPETQDIGPYEKAFLEKAKEKGFQYHHATAWPLNGEKTPTREEMYKDLLCMLTDENTKDITSELL